MVYFHFLTFREHMHTPLTPHKSSGLFACMRDFLVILSIVAETLHVILLYLPCSGRRPSLGISPLPAICVLRTQLHRWGPSCAKYRRQ